MEGVYVVKMAKFRHMPSPLKRKIMKKKSIKTTTLSALMSVSKTETGMDYVQVMPDNPCGGLVEPFHGLGYGQMLGNGAFDFVRKKRIRRKPEKKTQYGSLSFGNDGYDRYIFVVPAEMRREFPKLLLKDARVMANYLTQKMKGE